MDDASRIARYLELQAYVGWTEEDARRVALAGPIAAPSFGELVEDFYRVIEEHPEARKVITGGPEQIARLKGTLVRWLGELFSGRYDDEYVRARWRVGMRHVEIGLDQVYTNVALSRLRIGLTRALHEGWRPGDLDEQRAAVRSLNKLLDLDLAIIEEAYHAATAERLQRSERLATLGQIAGGVAHELRNPLNVVKTSVYYLLHARNPSPAKKEEHLKRIERHVGLADGVITSLSNFARMPTPDLRPTPLGPLIREAIEINPVGEATEVVLDVPAELPPVQADAGQLGIVFGNLIRNARDAMPEGGRMAISARLEGEAVAVAVADSGVGIPPEHLQRVFEPLYSTKARGLGLGLAIVRSILEKSRGALHVESEPGRGTTFTVRLTPSESSDGGTP